MAGPSKSEREAGIALLMVMIGLVVISVLALGVVLVTKSGVEEANTDLEASEKRAFLDAVVLQTGVALLDTSNPNRPRVDGVPETIIVLGQKVSVSITSEFGKVDINAADATTLSNLFEAAGKGPSEANNEANQVINWRTDGNGPENIRLFRVATEITQVPSIDQGLYDKIASAITVYSGRSRVDETTAPLLALEAMPGMDRLSAEALIRNRATNRTDASRIGEVVNGTLTPGIGITGWAFTVSTDSSLGIGREAGTEVIRITGDAARPFFVLWRS